ncbi:unnamed protein product [Knipowitschia caucasica]
MPTGVTECQILEAPFPVSFSGSGFLATYQLGVAQCLSNYAPWILESAPCVFGASAGSLVATAVVCGIDYVSIRDEMLHFAKQVKTFTLGPLNPSINVLHWLEHILQKYVPKDAHTLASGRLAVAVTRLQDGKHMVITEYHSKEDVVQALLCSCYVPGYCGMIPPCFKGSYYIDGGFTGMQPVHPQCPTLTVSPFSGDGDICPADAPCLWEMEVSGATLMANGANYNRVINALYPSALEYLEDAFDRGFKDATSFLLRSEFGPSLILDSYTHEKTCGQKKPRENLTSFNAITQTKGSKEDSIRKQIVMHLDFIENVLLSNFMTDKNMVGVTGKLFSYLLLPLLLVLFTVRQSWHRLQFWLRKSPQWIFWTWAGLRQLTFFLYLICMSTIRKNIYDRVQNLNLMLMWINFRVEVDKPLRKQEDLGATASARPNMTHNQHKKIN